MSNKRSICKRCHRLKVVNRAGYCVGTCSVELRAAEQPRRIGHAAPAAEAPPPEQGPMFYLPEIDEKSPTEDAPPFV